MRTIQPLPVEDIVALAEMCAGRTVMMDGYDGAAVLGAVADQAAFVLAHNPRARADDPGEDRMITYVRRALTDRGLHRTAFVGGRIGTPLYEQYKGAMFGRVIIDPDETDTDVPDRVRRAIEVTDTVYLVDRRDAYTFESLGLGAAHHMVVLTVSGIALKTIQVGARHYTGTEA